MTDDQFEQRLRGFLAAREPVAVSPVLRARLQSVTAESPVRSGGWIGWLGGTWRAAVGLAAVAAVAVVLLAVLLRTDPLTVQDRSPVGRPSAIPGLATVPFVTAPDGLFTPATVADAERRLAAVFAATGVEATFQVRTETSTQHVSVPAGWPERFDRDGDPDRDVMAVIGIAPDGTPVCCLTLKGDLITRAHENGMWRPITQPGALDDDLAEPTAKFRDGALIDFVRGIEDMAPGIATLESQGFTTNDIQRAFGLVAILVPLLVLAVVGLRRRTVAMAAPGGVGELGTEAEWIDVSRPAPTSVVESSSERDPQPRVAWAAYAWGAWSDRRLVFVSLAAMAGLGLVAVMDLLLPPSTSVRLDAGVDGMGRAVQGVSIAPFVLVAIAIGSLAAYARQGRWLRRVGVVMLVAVVGWAMSSVVNQTVPSSLDQDRGWVAGAGGEVSYGLDGFMENVTYRLAPGESFTIATKIRNPGPLPLTILGLDGVRTTQPNPYVGSIVSLGWVVQPTDGPITYLSANPADASASWPVTLGPGEELAIAVVGRAGPCADPAGIVNTVPLGYVDLAYRSLGVRRTAEVGLPPGLFLTSKSPCTVEVPGGRVTYSTPTE
jgi:hypothetical protein